MLVSCPGNFPRPVCSVSQAEGVCCYVFIVNDQSDILILSKTLNMLLAVHYCTYYQFSVSFWSVENKLQVTDKDREKKVFSNCQADPINRV